MLQDAAERGDLDPWDVDVIAVVDGFLDQLHQRITMPRLAAAVGGSYEQDLSEASEAFLAASVLVGLKAEVLEASTLPPEPLAEDDFDTGPLEGCWAEDPALALPRRPERHLLRRPVAPPPLQRPVTLGELIRQLEEIAERLDQDDLQGRRRSRPRRLSDRAAIEQVANLAHREKLPETTAALSRFLRDWPEASDWVAFDTLVDAWDTAVREGEGEEALDSDRVGVFWALLFLCHQGSLELVQTDGLFGPLALRRLQAAEHEQVQSIPPTGSADLPAVQQLAA
jgi:segregation and condensation protein A